MLRTFLLLAAATLGAAPPPSSPPDLLVLEEVRQMREVEFQKELNLPEDRAKALADRWAAADKNFINRGRRMRDIRKQMEDELRRGNTEDEKNRNLQPLVDELRKLRRAQESDRLALEEDLAHGLTAAQQARMILLTGKLQDWLHQAMRDARRGAAQ